MEQVTVYREPGRFAGWPANYGIWSWGNEIVVGFTLGYVKASAGFHARDTDRPFTTMQGRSLDGGESWEVVRTPLRSPGGRALSADEHMRADLRVGEALPGEKPQTHPGGIDFEHPDFAMMCARSGLTAGARSWFYTSYDRCRSWEGPYALPMFGQKGIAARTDYMVDGPRTCTLFLTAANSRGEEGRVFAARTEDGGGEFRFLSWIGPELEGFSIMPASLRLPGGRILVAVRCREKGRNWIDLYASDDDALSWEWMTTPVENTGIGGNPPTLLGLPDGRLCITYGYRDPPYSMRAVLSPDEGATWEGEIILRDGGGNHDIGYPRSVLRPDGTVVTVYYFNEEADGDRYMEATLWKP